MQHPTRVCVMLLACTCLFIYKIHQDLGNSMILSGNVQGTVGSVGDKMEYIQILVVIKDDVEDYKEFGPESAVIFELPEKANEYGIGFSRHYAKKLAEKLCPDEFPFCLMLDDSVQCWSGITLPSDPLKPAKCANAVRYL